MLEPQYKRDLEHSYLVLPDESSLLKQTYLWEMIEENKITEFLKCKKHFFNGSTFLYYDISSKQSIKRVYEHIELGYDEIKNMLLSIYFMYYKIKEYLLDENYLILDPNFIYMNMESKEVSFIYYLSGESSLLEELQNLSEFLLSKVNHKDAKGVEIVYQLFKEVREDNFTIQAMADLIGKIQERTEEIEDNVKIDNIENCKNPAQNLFFEIEEEIINMDKEKTITLKFPTVYVALCIFVSLFCIIYRIMIPDTPYLVLLYGMVMMSLVTGSLIIINYLELNKKKKKNFYKEENSVKNKFLQEKKEEKKEMIIKTQNQSQQVPYIKIYGNTEQFGIWKENDNVELQEEKELLEQLDHYLEGQIEGEDVIYYMKDAPFTVGKMEHCVNILIDHPSISRLHGKIFQEKEKTWLSDTNSTNGTYKNGVRLNPNETVEINSDDTVAFAEFVFTYH